MPRGDQRGRGDATGLERRPSLVAVRRFFLTQPKEMVANGHAMSNQAELARLIGWEPEAGRGKVWLKSMAETLERLDALCSQLPR